MNPVGMLLIAGLGTGLVLIWFFLFKKTKTPAMKPFLPAWREYLTKEVHFYRNLSSDERLQFESRIQSFLQAVSITGVGTDINDIDRLLVATSAVIPVFHFSNWTRYPNLDEVLIYPNAFREGDYATQGEDRNVLGMVGWGPMNRKIIFSRPSLHRGFEQEGLTNTGIHEFIHLIDKADGATDGVPEYLLEKQYVLPWIQLIYQEIEAIRSGKSDIPPYGATNQTEFFAVAGTYFFQQPHRFASEHPELFQMLEDIFNSTLNKHQK